MDLVVVSVEEDPAAAVLAEVVSAVALVADDLAEAELGEVGDLKMW